MPTLLARPVRTGAHDGARSFANHSPTEFDRIDTAVAQRRDDATTTIRGAIAASSTRREARARWERAARGARRGSEVVDEDALDRLYRATEQVVWRLLVVVIKPLNPYAPRHY